jgi:hypothetical protein
MTLRMKALIIAINVSLLLWAGIIGTALWVTSDGVDHNSLTAGVEK